MALNAHIGIVGISIGAGASFQPAHFRISSAIFAIARAISISAIARLGGIKGHSRSNRTAWYTGTALRELLVRYSRDRWWRSGCVVD